MQRLHGSEYSDADQKLLASFVLFLRNAPVISLRILSTVFSNSHCMRTNLMDCRHPWRSKWFEQTGVGKYSVFRYAGTTSFLLLRQWNDQRTSHAFCHESRGKISKFPWHPSQVDVHTLSVLCKDVLKHLRNQSRTLIEFAEVNRKRLLILIQKPLSLNADNQRSVYLKREIFPPGSSSVFLNWLTRPLDTKSPHEFQKLHKIRFATALPVSRRRDRIVNSRFTFNKMSHEACSESCAHIFKRKGWPVKQF